MRVFFFRSVVLSMWKWNYYFSLFFCCCWFSSHFSSLSSFRDDFVWLSSITIINHVIARDFEKRNAWAHKRKNRETLTESENEGKWKKEENQAKGKKNKNRTQNILIDYNWLYPKIHAISSYLIVCVSPSTRVEWMWVSEWMSVWYKFILLKIYSITT